MTPPWAHPYVQAVLLYYDRDHATSGLALLPGELFGHPATPEWATLRATVSVDTGTICQLVDRLRAVARLLLGGSAPEVIDYALRRAQRVANLDAILSACRY